MWQQWTNGILGLVVLATPFVSLTAPAALWSTVVLGLAIAVLGFWGAVEHQQMMDTGGKFRHA
jgi:hypothetical protein